MKKKKFGDRKDAVRCTDVNGINQILIDLKPTRSLGEVYINQKMDVTSLVAYLKKLKDKGEKITYFHAFCTLFGKTIYNRPLLNRFVQNRHIYEHDDITLSYVMKIDFTDKSKEIMVVLPIKNDDNLFSLSKKIGDKVTNVRNHQDSGNGANNAIDTLSKLPNIIRIPVIGLMKLLDRYGVLPNSLIKDNIYYSSMVVSNVGTFDCDGIYHNITDFGTCSGLITIGKIREEKVQDKVKYYCEFGITMDERIADGFYFIKSIQLMQYILNNPKLLEGRIDETVEITK